MVNFLHLRKVKKYNLQIIFSCGFSVNEVISTRRCNKSYYIIIIKSTDNYSIPNSPGENISKLQNLNVDVAQAKK